MSTRLLQIVSDGYLSDRSEKPMLMASNGYIPVGKIDQTLNYPLQISLNTGRTFIQTNTGKKFIKIEEM